MRPLLKRWWFWGGAFVLAGLLAAGIAFAGQSKLSQPTLPPPTQPVAATILSKQGVNEEEKARRQSAQQETARQEGEIQLRIEQQIHELVPYGTTVFTAEERMRAKGYTCSYGKHLETGRAYLYCDKRDGGWIVFRRTQVSIYYQAGKVTQVEVSIGLTGL